MTRPHPGRAKLLLCPDLTASERSDAGRVSTKSFVQHEIWAARQRRPTMAKQVHAGKRALPLLIALLFAMLSAPAFGAQPPARDALHWYRGNLHTHSFWSDGDDFPESIADWYKTNGYQFLAFSDHNIVLQGPSWRNQKSIGINTPIRRAT